MAIRMMANGDNGPRICHPLMSQGTSPATTPGAAAKKTALPTAAPDLCMSKNLGRQPLGILGRSGAEDRLADPQGGRPVLDCQFKITRHAHGQFVVTAGAITTTLKPPLQVAHAFEASPDVPLVIR